MLLLGQDGGGINLFISWFACGLAIFSERRKKFWLIESANLDFQFKVSFCEYFIWSVHLFLFE